MRATKWIIGSSLIILLGVAPVTMAKTRVKARVGVHVGFGAQRSYAPRGFFYRPYNRFGYFGASYYGPRVVKVQRVNFGEVDFNVKPDKSKVYVNGKYLGIADDFNGYPQTAKLPAGYYNVRIVSPTGQIEERRIYVAAGEEYNYNLKF